MAQLTRNQAHLVVAAIRVLEHRLTRPPEPAEVAEILDLDESSVRLQINQLNELGIALLVDSAFSSHVEIKDHTLIENLGEDSGPEISEDLAAFDRRKEEEARRMADLFDSGEHEKRRQEKIRKMDEELGGFRNRKKPPNPFGD